MKKKLALSKEDKKLAGVCGGIAAYFETDSSLIRVAWVLGTCICGLGLLAYIICAFVLPKE